MLKKIKPFVKKHDILYVICKSVQRMNDPLFIRIIRGYYDGDYQEATTLLLEHCGEIMPDKIVYDISRGEEKLTRMGFCASMHHLLYGLKFAEMINAVPRVLWSKNMPYYDHGMDDITKNAFEYYFEPISEAANYSFNEFKNILKSKPKDILIYQDMFTGSYSPNEDNIRELAESYRKHIHLNERTRKIIFDDIKGILKNNERILGIHARGGDFQLGLKNHPHIVQPDEYLKKAQEEFNSGSYDKIFLATDDENILKMFINNFGNRLVYYSDVPRVSSDNGNIQGIHLKESSRPLHHYKLGLEILRDVYTLVSCNSLLCGLSHVSFMVRYVKESLGEQFEKVTVLNEGIN